LKHVGATEAEATLLQALKQAEAADDQAEVAQLTAQLNIRIRTILSMAAQELSWIKDSSVGQVDDTEYRNGALQVLSDSTFDEDDADEQTGEIPLEAFKRVFWLWAVGAFVTFLLVSFRLCSLRAM